MPETSLHILFVGDIVGKPGLELTETVLKSFLQKYKVDFCFANGENLVEGKGINEEYAKRVFDLGVHVITGGNHTWDNWSTRKVLASNRNVLRPLNYPADNPGNGFIVYDLGEKGKIGVLNLQGRVYMQPIDCPFKKAEWAVGKIREQTNVVLVDFHAEATAEKVALGWFLDGQVSALFGTHTHIQTADARILPKGTAYITDLGMVGPIDSVIGMETEDALYRFLNNMPRHLRVAGGRCRFNSVLIDLDDATGVARTIERVDREIAPS